MHAYDIEASSAGSDVAATPSSDGYGAAAEPSATPDTSSGDPPSIADVCFFLPCSYYKVPYSFRAITSQSGDLKQSNGAFVNSASFGVALFAASIGAVLVL